MQCGVGHARAWGQKARFLRAILEIWLPYLLPWAPLDGHCQPLWLHHSLRDPQGFIFPATPNCLSLPTESTVARASVIFIFIFKMIPNCSNCVSLHSPPTCGSSSVFLVSHDLDAVYRHWPVIFRMFFNLSSSYFSLWFHWKYAL